jgi:leucyl-tRNA---protein transferase
MYEHWDQLETDDFSDSNIEQQYAAGFVYTRLGKGVMHGVESMRIDLSEFEQSSENRRVLKKNEGLELAVEELPMKDYSWEIGKMAKDFYAKFGDKVMSANKIKEMLTEADKSNMNSLFSYSLDNKAIGYCSAVQTNKLVHYAYPFYNLEPKTYNLGMGMILKAIVWAKEQGKEYIYLGTKQKYKEQFKGVEYFNRDKWVNL